ncbi:MAG: hypothetical protein ACXABY_26750, partial [Candidatus Thorarchaeota archaeon]
MRRTSIPLIVVVLILAMPLSENQVPVHSDHSRTNTPNAGTQFLPSDASGAGSSSQAMLFMGRTFTGLQTSVVNEYSDSDKHNGSLDLSSYLVSGWTLYKAVMNVTSMEATVEREVVGSTSSPGLGYRIEEYNPDVYYSDLAQGFYSQPHDGRLLNYSVVYSTFGYVTATRGTAYLEIRSIYDSTTNLTNQYALTAEEVGFAWHTTSGENLSLSQNSEYFAVINGTDLHEDGVQFRYPTIYWGVESITGDFETRRYSTEFSAWSNSLANLEGV